MPKFDLENWGDGQGVKQRNLHHSTGNVRIHLCDFLRILSTWEHTFTQKVHTHTNIHTHIDTQRETWVMTIGNICKVDLPKNELPFSESFQYKQTRFNK